ncbi:uncharacterized protein LOC110665925 [Hevea brasiliensis]|uniref:uncharacterized protein LOC110665925 n=1 Tax=Hevea brasiliensis TaxID=3981 RepID=UPI0025F22B2D|nr:uncharacterized protein LOC110665925 [Hevea brasiliensis]
MKWNMPYNFTIIYPELDDLFVFFLYIDLDALGNLEELRLGGNQITKVVASRDIRISRNLSSLILDYNTAMDRSIQLELLGAYPFLKTLSLQHNSFKGGNICSRQVFELFSLVITCIYAAIIVLMPS